MTTPSRLKQRLFLVALTLAVSELGTWLALMAFPWFIAAPFLTAIGYAVVYEAGENW